MGEAPGGLPDQAIELYEAIVGVSDANRERLAASSELGDGEVAELVKELLVMGLIEEAPDGTLKPSDPAGPFRRLVHEAENQVSNARKARESLDVLEKGFLALYQRHLEHSAEHRAIEIVRDVDSVNERLHRLLGGKPTSSLSLHPGPSFLTEEQVKRALVREIRALRAGTFDRTLVDSAYLASDLGAHFATTLAENGSQIRVSPEPLPIRCILMDGLALLPLTGDDDGSAGAMFIHSSSIVQALLSLGEMIWRVAHPLASTTATETNSLTTINSDEHRLLDLLATGMPDEAIARQLGISPRTVRRRVSTLCERLGVRSRFQLALHATKHGWPTGHDVDRRVPVEHEGGEHTWA